MKKKNERKKMNEGGIESSRNKYDNKIKSREKMNKR